MNNVVLVGRLGNDPDLRQTNTSAVCKLSVATDESRKNQSGEWEKYPEWHRIVVFGKDAENAKKYLVKGSQVAIYGSLKTNKWDKEGVTHYTTEILAHRVEYLSSPQEKSDTSRLSAMQVTSQFSRMENAPWPALAFSP